MANKSRWITRLNSRRTNCLTRALATDDASPGSRGQQHIIATTPPPLDHCPLGRRFRLERVSPSGSIFDDRTAFVH